MTLAEAVEVVVSRTGVERYRVFATQGPAHEAEIFRMAAELEGKPVAPPPVITEDSRLVARVETCDFRRSSCGCLGKPAECLQGGWPAIVVFDDCRACIAAA